MDGGAIVVCDTQPWAEPGRAEVVRRNIDNGTGYNYFLSFSEGTVDKICQSVQMIAWAGIGGVTKPSDFKSRTDTIRNNKDPVLDDLRSLCQSSLLRVSLLVDDPIVCFRVHNATDPMSAQLYAKYSGGGFVRWEKGQSADALWRMFPQYREEDKGDRIFLPMKYPALSAEQTQRLESILGRGLTRYFPGMELEVKQIFLGGRS